ncbi:MAG: hypothetical protein AAGK23_02310 [Pseudomonadota bacterium]
MKTIIVGLGAAIAALGLSACSTYSASEKLELETANAVLDSTDDDVTVTVAAVGEDDPMVCRRMAVSGSRLQKQRVCARESEWENNREIAQKNVDDILRRSTFGVLNPGG